MNVMLLNPPFLRKFSRPQRSPAVTKSGTLYFPIWLAYCAAVLDADGFLVSLIDAPAAELSLDDVLQLTRKIQPALVVMDTSTPSIANDIDIATKIKQVVPRAFIVMVGTHVSALAEEALLSSDAVGAVARREYEYTVRDLARLMRDNPGGADISLNVLDGIEGLSFRHSGSIQHNPDRPYIDNLDELPWVSRIYKRYLRIGDYFNPNALYPMVTLITSRGCPFRCSFCVYPQVFAGRAYRFRSVEDVVSEMEFIAREFPQAKSIFFEDDTLMSNRKRAVELAEAILDRGVDIPWTANSRIDLDLETMRLVRRAGCRQLCVGFESGDQEVLNGMRKGTRVERMFRFMEDARRAGILIHGCFMVGFAGETRSSIDKTIELAIRLRPDTVQFYPVMVYPGTEAYEEYASKGWITAQSYREWLTPEGLHNCVVRNETLSSEELVRLCDLARKRFYLRPGYLLYKLGRLARCPSEIGRTVKASRTFFKHLIMGSRV